MNKSRHLLKISIEESKEDNLNENTVKRYIKKIVINQFNITAEDFDSNKKLKDYPNIKQKDLTKFQNDLEKELKIEYKEKLDLNITFEQLFKFTMEAIYALGVLTVEVIKALLGSLDFLSLAL